MAIWYRIDILEEIARQIKLPEDFVVFSGVCRLWRSAASKKNSRLRASVVPWLMLPPKEKGSDVRSFFSLSKGQFYAIDVRGGITAIDIKSDNTVVAKRVVADLPLELVPLEFWTKFYLVESAGKILAVARKLTEVTQTYANYGTTGFRVVELDLSRNENEWSPVKNLVDLRKALEGIWEFITYKMEALNTLRHILCVVVHYPINDLSDSHLVPAVAGGPLEVKAWFLGKFYF
ncbi:hypothetical protein QYF36_025092 [Acer negundo]|nr:hypothetical protein QYF36_025092 [Acer negundo]